MNETPSVPRIIQWKPHPKQELALRSAAFEILFGGARGGGKSEALIMWLLYPINTPTYRALVIRRNFVDLMDWFERAKAVYCSAPFHAKTRGGYEFEFPSGAKIKLGHIQDKDAYTKYQGHEYQRIGIEELTQIPTEELYLKIIASCRSTNGIRPAVFATCNPGEVGTAWVKRRFVSPERPMTMFEDPISGRTRVYIPATVEDNPTIIEKDPDYVNYLNSLPPDLKAWWRYGSWDEVKIKGAIYGDELEEALQSKRITSVSYNPNLPVYTGWDLGLRDHQVCWFFQVLGDEVRFIDTMAANNKNWDYWVQQLVDSHYNFSTVYLPHDGTKKSADTLLSFKHKLEAAGFKVELNVRTKSVYNDIQKVRAIFHRFSFDEEYCADSLDYLKKYRYEWKSDTEMFTPEPVHDVSSHYADAFRESVMGVLKLDKKTDDRKGGFTARYEPKPSPNYKIMKDTPAPMLDNFKELAQSPNKGYKASHAQFLSRTSQYNNKI